MAQGFACCTRLPAEAAESERQGRGDSGPGHTFPLSQKITDNIKGKVCSLAVCAVAWLVAHVRMLGLDEREKSLQMIRQLAGPLYSENTLQFYNERSVTRPSLPECCRSVVRSGTSRNRYLTPLNLPRQAAHLLTHFLARSHSWSRIHSLTQQQFRVFSGTCCAQKYRPQTPMVPALEEVKSWRTSLPQEQRHYLSCVTV